MWVITDNKASERTTMFHYSPARKTSEADWLLSDFNGALMTDGYAVYDSVCKTKQIENLGCWAHTGRYFKEGLDVNVKIKQVKPRQHLLLFKSCLA
jgi:transposase